MKKVAYIILGLLLILAASIVIIYISKSVLIQPSKKPSLEQQPKITQLQTGESFVQLVEEHKIIVDYIKNNITEIMEPFSGEGINGKWYATQFWFTSDENIYVSYEDGHVLLGSLLKCINSENDILCQVEATFGVSGGKWKLIQGQDTQEGKSIIASWPKNIELKR